MDTTEAAFPDTEGYCTGASPRRAAMDPNLPFILTVDDNGFGWGLWQTQGNRSTLLSFVMKGSLQLVFLD